MKPVTKNILFFSFLSIFSVTTNNLFAQNSIQDTGFNTLQTIEDVMVTTTRTEKSTGRRRACPSVRRAIRCRADRRPETPRTAAPATSRGWPGARVRGRSTEPRRLRAPQPRCPVSRWSCRCRSGQGESLSRRITAPSPASAGSKRAMPSISVRASLIRSIAFFVPLQPKPPRLNRARKAQGWVVAKAWILFFEVDVDGGGCWPGKLCGQLARDLVVRPDLAIQASMATCWASSSCCGPNRFGLAWRNRFRSSSPGSVTWAAGLQAACPCLPHPPDQTLPSAAA